MKLALSETQKTGFLATRPKWSFLFLLFIEYFKKKGVCTLTVKELFDFVTDLSITADNLDEYLDHCMALASSRTLEDITAQEKIDEEVQY